MAGLLRDQSLNLSRNLMKKTLCLYGVGVAARPNELIELALTYKFDGLEVDMEDMLARAESVNKQFAVQYLTSASSLGVASFRLPMALSADDSKFEKSVQKLPLILDLAKTVGADCCYVVIDPASSDHSFHENFELHRKRLATLAATLAGQSIRLGLALNAVPAAREGKDYQFVRKAEEILALVRAVGADNVGLMLETWNWQLGEGGMDQLAELSPDRITEVRLADLPLDYNAETIGAHQRAMPGAGLDSICLELVRSLHRRGFAGPVSIAARPTTGQRLRIETLVERLSRALDQLLADAGVIELAAEVIESPPPAAESANGAPEQAEKVAAN
jgi:sugar phosphate isomerase/epimerase